MSGNSAKVRPAWIQGREARDDERIRPLPFPRPPPEALLRGFVELQERWESSGRSVVRFVVDLVAAPAAVQSLAVVLIDFAPDRDAWVQLLCTQRAPQGVQDRLLSPVDFDALSASWCSTHGGDARHELLQAWEEASRALPPEPSRRNLMKSHKARHPSRWRHL